MPVILNVKTPVKEMERVIGRISHKVLPQATARSINISMRTVNKRTIQEIAIETGSKQKLVRRFVLITFKASRNKLISKLFAKPHRANLIEFVAPSKRKPGAFAKKSGVVAKAWGRRRKIYKDTFIVRGKKSGKAIVVARHKDASRYGSIDGHPGGWKSGWSKTIYGPGIRGAFSQAKITRMQKAIAEGRFNKVFPKEVLFYLNRYLKR